METVPLRLSYGIPACSWSWWRRWRRASCRGRRWGKPRGSARSAPSRTCPRSPSCLFREEDNFDRWIPYTRFITHMRLWEIFLGHLISIVHDVWDSNQLHDDSTIGIFAKRSEIDRWIKLWDILWLSKINRTTYGTLIKILGEIMRHWYQQYDGVPYEK